MPIDIAAVRARKKARQQPVTIILDPDVEETLFDARAAQERAQRRADDHPTNSAAATDLAEANEALTVAETAAREASQVFRFQALGREAYEALRDEHPPTKKQRDEYKAKGLAMGLAAFQIGDLAYNAATFPPALVAAACVEPAMELEDAQAIWDEWSSAECSLLFSAALSVNETSRQVELGKG